MVASSRLHREIGRFRPGINSIPEMINPPSNNFIPYFKRATNFAVAAPEEEPETVYINMKVDSEEEPETKYVNLVIDTKRNVNG